MRVSRQGFLNRVISFITILGIAAAGAGAAEQHGQLDSSQTLFAVFAAINAAGYDTDLASSANHPLRMAVRKELAAKKLPVLEDLRYFVRKHHKDNSANDLGQYISFA